MDKLWLAVQFGCAQPGDERTEERGEFHPGESRSEAHMRAGTEGEVPVRIAGYVELERVFEHVLVAVGGRVAFVKRSGLASMAVMSAWRVKSTAI